MYKNNVKLHIFQCGRKERLKIIYKLRENLVTRHKFTFAICRKPMQIELKDLE